ncbi:MAG: leuC3, partial [Clostridiaceae bacterium]|nr:leuC3 [Clostridiaceae bacterium]
TDAADYDRINQDDKLVIKNVKELVSKGEFVITNETQGFEIKTYATLSDRQKEVLLAGGQLNFIKKLL